jgi:SHS2 domain-containing protein
MSQEKETSDIEENLEQETNESKKDEKEEQVKSGEGEEDELDQSIPDKKYEYLDHTADVQLHSWGSSMKESFEQIAMAMFGYMTDIETVEIMQTQEIEVQLDEEEDDLINLVYHWLDEWLFTFCAEPFFIPRKVLIKEFDLEKRHIKAVGYGEQFSLEKHPQGTEVKAITYSNLQVHNEISTNDIYVIIDI